MSIVIIRNDGKTDLWKAALLRQDSTVKVYDHREDHPREAITMALIWKHPKGSLRPYPNLKCIASAGAGVDFIFEDPEAPTHLPITRVVDPYLASDMSEHVLAVILGELKHLYAYKAQQLAGHWQPRSYARIQDVTVGVMGLGELGALTAKDLARVGFRVLGWSRTQKDIPGVSCFHGEAGQREFLSKANMLVCLLPLTPETTGILNREVFARLPKGAYVVNVARGGHLVDVDLLEQIDAGHLSGACLDVYHQEPLPKGHPFWKHPKIMMTPHYASVSDTHSVVPQILENYHRLSSGKELLHQVDKDKGY
ncbi:2-hydroxyacid dehydrogenase [Maribacter sp. 2307ULW6-5]|uniref:2-hydroxyacid dehydrogenase n=1 Tax=Maribacter sp. 2307ULW6-5 TaxID=3386275 RepID=UPI0039BC7415